MRTIAKSKGIRTLTIALAGLFLMGCGENAGFSGGSISKSSNDTELESGTGENSADALGNARTPTDGDTIVGAEDVAGAAGSAGDPGDADNGADITAGDLLVDCAQTERVKTYQVEVTFAPQRDCQWGVGNQMSANGNLSIMDQFLRAREDQVHKVSVPKNAGVCGIGFNSQSDRIHFDDFYALHVNNIILASSNVVVKHMERDAAGFYKWDWPMLRDQPMENLGHYCLAGQGSCELPEHDRPGRMSLDLSLDEDASEDSPQAQLFAALSGATSLDFVATATGDNDDGDCEHSGGTFMLDISYIAK